MLTQEILREILHYDPETGLWSWLKPASRNIKPGDRAGSFSGRYIRIQIWGTHYQSGRLAWFYMTGEWPPNLIDHKDRDSHNDKWENLRLATHSENNFNRYTDIRGVAKTGNRWRAQVGPYEYVGTFDTFEEAVVARDIEARRLGGDFAIMNSDTINGQ